MRRNVFAVLRLMTSRYLSGSTTGRSPAFSPLEFGGIDTGLPPDVGRVGAVADQATLGDEVGHSYMTGTDSRAARETSRSRFI